MQRDSCLSVRKEVEPTLGDGPGQAVKMPLGFSLTLVSTRT